MISHRIQLDDVAVSLLSARLCRSKKKAVNSVHGWVDSKLDSLGKDGVP